MPTCPNGHQSAADDWCEVCGHRMAGVQAAPPTGNGFPPPPPPPPAGGGHGYPGQPPESGYHSAQPPHAESCPVCATQREMQAPFCENCGYNFLTHSPTAHAPSTHAPPNPPQPGDFPPAGESSRYPNPPSGLDYSSSGPSRMNRPAEQLGPQQPEYPQGAGAYGPSAPQPPQPSGDWVLPPPSAPQPPRHPQQQPHPAAPASQDYSQPPPGYPDPSGHPVPPPVPAQVPQQPAAPQPTAWVAVVGPDRDYFMAMMERGGPEAAELHLPAYNAELQLPLTGHQVTIGRRRHATGEVPDIDLGRPPEDPGVSHQHAVLVQQPDGNWSVVDQDSTNGTTINGSEDSIQPYVPVPLLEGDRVHVGAWTTITLRRA